MGEESPHDVAAVPEVKTSFEQVDFRESERKEVIINYILHMYHASRYTLQAASLYI